MKKLAILLVATQLLLMTNLSASTVNTISLTESIKEGYVLDRFLADAHDTKQSIERFINAGAKKLVPENVEIDTTIEENSARINMVYSF